MPMNEETGESHGFCFVKFPNQEEAEQAMKTTQGLEIDKKHAFKVSMYSDMDKFAAVPDIYASPPATTFNTRADPTQWLADSACRDQFVTRHGHDTTICWANNVVGEEPTVVYGGEREKQDGKVWCESFVTWSPQGSYLATFHLQGIKLWGGGEFEPKGRFIHSKVDDLSFSPCENYLVTYRYAYQAELNPAEAIIVWDIRTVKKLRCFELKNPLDLKFYVQATITIEEKIKYADPADLENSYRLKQKVIQGRVKSYEGDSLGGVFTIEEGNKLHEGIASDKVQPIQEPNRLKWSPDGKYVARLGNDIISVYTLPSMKLLDQKSIAAKEVLDFVWSPRSNNISYWSPAVGNHPALINVMKLPEREDVASRKLFDVLDGRMVWQNEGSYLCVYMTKVQGKKRSHVLMFFRTKDAGVPVEQIELAEPILSVNWEPSGDRIIIMYGEVRNPIIAVYSMQGNPADAKPPPTVAGQPKSTVVAVKKEVKNELTLLFLKTGSNCTEVLWSPFGGYCAFAYFASDACVFELYDIEANVSMASKRHDRCNKLYWDPSGRYIASCTITEMRNANTKGQPDDGYNVYTFQGLLHSQVKQEKMYQFAWRPRPKDLLSPEDRKKVIKNLRKYERLFDQEDRKRKQELVEEVQQQRFKKAEEFYAVFGQCRSVSRAKKARRVALRGGYDSDDENNYRYTHA
jgi:translation initiation factor 3 subunit B